MRLGKNGIPRSDRVRSSTRYCWIETAFRNNRVSSSKQPYSFENSPPYPNLRFSCFALRIHRHAFNFQAQKIIRWPDSVRGLRSPDQLWGSASRWSGLTERVKTTIFRIILGEEEADRGEVNRDEYTLIGFLPQESEDVGDHTVIEIATGRAGMLQELEVQLKALEVAGTVDVPEYYEAQGKFDALNNPQVEAKAKKMLRGLGYQEEDFLRPAKEMSGGWIMRAHLARLLVIEPDLLMLDEPTNHLDLMSLLWFQDYLKNYSGAILMISHDRHFMNALTESVHEIDNKKLVHYTGNYSDFEDQRLKNYENANYCLQKSAETDQGNAGLCEPFPQRDVEGITGPV